MGSYKTMIKNKEKIHFPTSSLSERANKAIELIAQGHYTETEFLKALDDLRYFVETHS
jgi:hypothetical protein